MFSGTYRGQLIKELPRLDTELRRHLDLSDARGLVLDPHELAHREVGAREHHVLEAIEVDEVHEARRRTVRDVGIRKDRGALEGELHESRVGDGRVREALLRL